MKPVSITEWGHTIMTYEPKRARRRRDLARMKAKAKRKGPTWEYLYDHLAVCSCWMCGNPRRYYKERTLAEQQFLAEPVELE